MFLNIVISTGDLSRWTTHLNKCAFVFWDFFFPLNHRDARKRVFFKRKEGLRKRLTLEGLFGFESCALDQEFVLVSAPTGHSNLCLVFSPLGNCGF